MMASEPTTEMQWQPFDRRTGTTHTDLFVRLDVSTMFLSHAAHAAIGNPDRVAIMYDPDRRVIGITPSDDVHSYAVGARYRSVAFGRFRNHYDITAGGRVPATLVDGVLRIPLDDADEPIASWDRKR